MSPPDGVFPHCCGVTQQQNCFQNLLALLIFFGNTALASRESEPVWATLPSDRTQCPTPPILIVNQMNLRTRHTFVSITWCCAASMLISALVSLECVDMFMHWRLPTPPENRISYTKCTSKIQNSVKGDGNVPLLCLELPSSFCKGVYKIFPRCAFFHWPANCNLVSKEVNNVWFSGLLLSHAPQQSAASSVTHTPTKCGVAQPGSTCSHPTRRVIPPKKRNRTAESEELWTGKWEISGRHCTVLNFVGKHW